MDRSLQMQKSLRSASAGKVSRTLQLNSSPILSYLSSVERPSLFSEVENPLFPILHEIL